MNKLLRMKDVATILQVNPKTVYEWVHQKRLVAVDIGTESRACWRIREADLKAFLESRMPSLSA